jgi:hypothetical protein
VADELSQPYPANPAFPHGQATKEVASPKHSGIIARFTTVTEPVGSVPAEPKTQLAGSAIAASQSAFVPLARTVVSKPMKLCELPACAKVTAVCPATDNPGGTLPSPVVVASSKVPVSSRTKRCSCVAVFIGFCPLSCWKAQIWSPLCVSTR